MEPIFMKSFIILISLLFSFFASANTNAPLVITDENQETWLKVHFNENKAQFIVCEKIKDNCHEVIGHKYFSKSDIAAQVERLNHESDSEIHTTVFLVVGTMIVTFGTATGSVYTLLKKLGHKGGLLKGEFKMGWHVAAGVSIGAATSIGIVYQILWADAGRKLKALSKATEPNEESVNLVLVKDIDQFIVDINDALLGIE